MNYTVYHLHTEDSLLDSCTNHKLYTDYAVELGQTAICFSEHGNIYNWVEKKMYANSKGLKYIHGCEVYLTETLKKKVRDNYHTILIAKNQEGFKEINSLIDLSTRPDHFYYKPRITFDEFFAISDNVIKISACLASPLNRYMDTETADNNIFDKLLRKYDYYEIQAHIHEDQITYNRALYQYSKKYNKPLIAGTDTHSINKYKAECRSILQKAKRIQYADEDSFDLTYKTYDELVAMFHEQGALSEDVYLEAIENTNVMADSVADFELDTEFKYPKTSDNEEDELKKRINDMYRTKVKKGIINSDKQYKQMVQEEFRVFKKIGMVGFILFMSKLVCWCWENGIPIGFCRGSVGGSEIAYLSDIIDVNPVVWNTIFSRFANEDRKEIGDIDIDVSPSQRHLVYKHIIEEFGKDKTAYVLAIGTVSDKGTIDEIGRALEYPLDKVAQIKREFEEDKEYAREKYPELFYYFDGLVGTAVSQSIHPAGIVVSPVTLPDNYGTFWNDGKRILTINMEEIHEVSLVKYDILGLKNVEIIKDCCELAGIPYPKSHEINWEDKDVWEHITDSPVGIFQFESAYAFKLLQEYKPKRVNDLSLVNASLRPSGESYRDRLIAGDTNKNPSELIDKLLEANHGYLVFQEDTIKFLTQICGLSGSEADNIRRAIGRKQKDRLEAALPAILEGYCSKSDKPRNIAEQEAKEFLQIIEDSSNYQFGYNHSTGYSMIGYLCGYLRYYYPVEFITAYLNNANNDDDLAMGTTLAKEMNITISPVKFRYTRALYSCDAKNRTIYKGISSIKFLNDRIADELYDLKDNKYNSFMELLYDIKKTSVNSKQLDILIKIGYFDEFGDRDYLLGIVKIFDMFGEAKQVSKKKLSDNHISEDVVRPYGNETKSMFNKLDVKGLMNAIIESIDWHKTTLQRKLQYENFALGMPITICPEYDKRIYFVSNIEQNKSVTNIKLYELFSGMIREVKMWNGSYDRNPILVNNMIKLLKVEKKNKRERTNKTDPNTGKPIYKAVPDKFEYWLSQYSIIGGGV